MASRPAYTKPTSELQTELLEQLAALEASCKNYDLGLLWEARRIASIIYILLHDGGRRSRSLLGQLGLKRGLALWSFCQGWSETSITSQTPLVAIKATPTGASYEPLLNDCPIPLERLPFSKWWDQPILRDSHRRIITRKNLVFYLRSQDGGAHVDGELTDEAYASISRGNGAGWFFNGQGTSASPLNPGPHWATMRQVGWEVQRSLAAIISETPRKE